MDTALHTIESNCIPVDSSISHMDIRHIIPNDKGLVKLFQKWNKQEICFQDNETVDRETIVDREFTAYHSLMFSLYSLTNKHIRYILYHEGLQRSVITHDSMINRSYILSRWGKTRTGKTIKTRKINMRTQVLDLQKEAIKLKTEAGQFYMEQVYKLYTEWEASPLTFKLKETSKLIEKAKVYVKESKCWRYDMYSIKPTEFIYLPAPPDDKQNRPCRTNATPVNRPPVPLVNPSHAIVPCENPPDQPGKFYQRDTYVEHSRRRRHQGGKGNGKGKGGCNSWNEYFAHNY